MALIDVQLPPGWLRQDMETASRRVKELDIRLGNCVQKVKLDPSLPMDVIEAEFPDGRRQRFKLIGGR